MNVFRGRIKEFVRGEGALVFLSRGGLSCSTRWGLKGPLEILNFTDPEGGGDFIQPLPHLNASERIFLRFFLQIPLLPPIPSL